MGNTLLDKPLRKKNDPLQEFESWLEQNPELMNKKLHQDNKSFRSLSFLYKSKAQSLMLKIYLKREEVNLEHYLRGFETIKKTVDPNYYHNMLPYMQFKNFDQPNEGFVVVFRQYLLNTLQDRLQSQPLPSLDQKIWIIFQMIICVYGLHVQCNLYHGNIRTSNFLIQSNDHLVLTDMASYKPLYLLEDDLSEVRIFYGSSFNKCTLAPEKLIKESNKFNRNPTQLLKTHKKEKNLATQTLTGGSQLKEQMSTTSNAQSVQGFLVLGTQLSMQSKSSQSSTSQYTNQVKNQKNMDIFSLGMSIIQVLLNGKTLMTFQNLLQFRKNQYSLHNYIDSAVDGLPQSQKIKALLIMMLQKDPEKRPSIEIIVNVWKQILGKQIHVLMWYLQSIFSKSAFILPDLRIGLLRKIIQMIEERLPTNAKYKMAMDLSTDIQKLDFLRMMMSLIDRNINPNLEKMGISGISLLSEIQKSLETKSQLQHQMEDSEINKQSIRSRGASVFQMKPKESSQKDSTNLFTSMENLKVKNFDEKNIKLDEEQVKHLCPPQWTPELQNFQRSKFKGLKLTQQEQYHNQFQDLLQEVKQSQHIRQRFHPLTHYHDYEQLIKLVFSNIRATVSVSNRLVAVELLYVLGRGASTKTKLTKVIPYLINIMGDSEERVATYSLRCLIDFFYSCNEIFRSAQDTRYFRTIIDGFNIASKSSVLRLILFERLSQILKIIQWLSVHQLRFTKSQNISQKNNLIESILKQYGSYTNNQKEVLLSNAARLWSTSFIRFFGEMMNTEKVLGFKQSIKIAEESQKYKYNQLDFIDTCLQMGLEQSGLAVFYTIRYFKIRKIIKQQLIIKIIPLILYPNRWVHEQVIEYVKMCLNNYPPTKLYFIFNKCLQMPFPIQPSDDLGLPSMLPTRALKQKKFNDKNKTVALFIKYLSRSKPQKQYPQNTEQVIKKWNEAAKDIISSESMNQQRRFSNSLGQHITSYINKLNSQNLLYYISLIKKPYRQQTQLIQGSTSDLMQLCDRSYSFNINNISNVSYYQKHLLMHIQSYLTTNSESFLKAQGLNSSYFKKLFAQNLTKTNSIINLIDQFQIIPTLQLGKFVRDPTEQSRLNRPMGILIGEIREHKDIVSCIQKITDRFFVSGSYDGTLRLFDCKKIEDDITSDSIGVIDFKQQFNQYSGTVKITSACVFEDTQTVAVATTKGNVGLYRAEYMSKDSPAKLSKSKKANSSLELIKTFNAIGEVQKVVTLKNQLKHSSFGVVTSEGWLALQDIRIKKQCYKCNLGKQRGMPKSFINLPGTNTLAVGTMNGYILLYDIRCNLVSNVYQLNSDGQSLPILCMQTVPSFLHAQDNQQLIAISYPSKNYELCYFDLNSSNNQNIHPEQLFTSSGPEDCIITPFLVNKTKSQSFKSCNNNLKQKSYYNNFLPEFYSKLDIIDYLKDQLTISENTVKEKWLSQSKQKFAQITSISHKKFLPFIEYLPGGILTNLNPIITSRSTINRQANKPGNNLTFLNLVPNKKQAKTINPIERQVRKVGKYTFIPDQQALDFYTSCKILPNFVVTGSRDSVVKIYK